MGTPSRPEPLHAVAIRGSDAPGPDFRVLFESAARALSRPRSGPRHRGGERCLPRGHHDRAGRRRRPLASSTSSPTTPTTRHRRRAQPRGVARAASCATGPVTPCPCRSTTSSGPPPTVAASRSASGARYNSPVLRPTAPSPTSFTRSRTSPSTCRCAGPRPPGPPRRHGSRGRAAGPGGRPTPDASSRRPTRSSPPSTRAPRSSTGSRRTSSPTSATSCARRWR